MTDERFNALKHIDALIKEHHLSQAEVLGLFEGHVVTQEPTAPLPSPKENKLHFTDVVYHIGGGIVLLGIWVLLGMSWTNLDSLSRIFISLGLTFVSYGAGIALSRTKGGQQASSSLYFVAITSLPIGLWALIDVGNYISYDSGMHTLLSLVCSLSAAGLFYLHRKTVFLLGAILYGTSCLVAATIFITRDSVATDLHLIEYLFILIGFAYMALAYFLSHTKHPRLIGFLYSFGLIYILGTTLLLGGWTEESADLLWMLLYPLLLAGGFYASVWLHRTSLLVLSTIFLTIYILKVTGIYFADSIGWPFALMLGGLLIIGATFLSTNLKKSYIK